MIQGAYLSGCRRYRYLLWRIWNPQLRFAVFVGLNPSTADAEVDDPTLKRCMAFAREWRLGGVVMANVFALRSADPSALLSRKDPSGPYNHIWLSYALNLGHEHIACWGNLGIRQASIMLSGALQPFSCLGVTNKGAPRHPLYVPSRQERHPFTVSCNKAE